MSAYNIIEPIFKKQQILNYEKIIKEIDEVYYNYRANEAVNFTIGTKAEYCLKEGIQGFTYYINGYVNSDFISDNFSLLVRKTQELVEKRIELQKKQKEELEKIGITFEYVIKSFGGIPKEDAVENFEIVLKKYQEKPQAFDAGIQSKLFMAGLTTVPEFKEVYKTIEKDIISKIKTGENIVTATKKILQEKKIDLDLDKFFDSIGMVDEFTEIEQEKQELYDELVVELPKAITADLFLSISTKLKNQVASALHSGLTEEEALNKVLPEAYGLVKAVCEYALGQTAYDVQLMGAIAMNEGKVCEMYTGEGKTLTAIFPAYLNALLGKEVDIFTPNDYLAERDAQKNKKVFELLGMSVGCVKVDGQSLEEKQKAYKCNIVYGSSNAFAFDYLNDTNRNDVENLVQRNEKPQFVIVDEADQILINNAQTPYILQNSSAGLSSKDKKRNQFIIESLEKALEIEKILSQSICSDFTEETFKNCTGYNKEETDKIQKEYSILYLNKENVVLTKKAQSQIFEYVLKDEIIDLTLKNRDYFLSNEEFIEDIDYTQNNEKITLTLTGIEKAINSTKDFFDLNMKWLTEEKYQIMRKYIDNAIKARYCLTRGDNGDYDVVFNPNTNREEVVVLQDGRILPDSKFTDGLHQAIELKEGLGVIVDNDEKLLDDSIASISNRALIARYGKVSGMTGTADKSMFSEVYGLDTFEVPKNKEYEHSKNPLTTSAPIKRKDHPTVLCKNQNDKLSLIINDIISSYKKGQPVLVVTSNAEEAKKINLILQELPEPYNNINSNLLIAEKTLEEEAGIIAEAGKLGSITIATEMAGRGTDIKLGGEKELDVELNKREIIEIEAINLKLERILNSLDYDGQITEEKRKYARNLICETFNENKDFLKNEISELEDKYTKDSYYKDKINYLVNERIQDKKKKVFDVGGLKYIQTTPFKTSRNDDQGKGRVGRQGEPGETRMYFSIDEAKELGITDNKTKEELSSLIGDKVYVTDEDANGIISDIIETAQSEIEFKIDFSIAMNDTNDLAMSSIGQMLLRNRKQVLASDKIDVMIENMIYSTIDSIIKDNVPPKKMKKVDKEKSRLSRLKLDFNGLNSTLKDIFGIEMDINEVFEECTNVGEVKQFIFNKVLEKKKELDLGVSKEKVESRNRKAILNSLNETYIDFMNEAQTIELQMMNDCIANNPSHNRVLEFQSLYKDCRKQGWYSCLKNVFRPGLKKTDSIEIISEEVQSLINELREESNYEDLYSSEDFNIKR